MKLLLWMSLVTIAILQYMLVSVPLLRIELIPCALLSTLKDYLKSMVLSRKKGLVY